MKNEGKGLLSFLRLTHPLSILFSVFYLLVLLLTGCVILGKLTYLTSQSLGLESIKWGNNCYPICTQEIGIITTHTVLAKLPFVRQKKKKLSKLSPSKCDEVSS